MWQRLGTVMFWLVWPGTWFLIRRSQRTRMLIRVGDEVLVTRTWLSDGRWSLPGGGLHHGEEPLSGVLREVREETGIRLDPPAVTALGPARYQGNGQSFLCHYFMAKLEAKPSITLQRFEISASRWTPVSEININDFGPDVLAAVAWYNKR